MNCFKILSIAFAALLFISCDPEDNTVKVTGIEITSTPDPLTLTVGGATGKVEARVLPADATDKTVTYSVDPEGVVTVAADGTVTPVGPGTATITVASVADATINKTCVVTVNTLLKDVNVLMSFSEDKTKADLVMKRVTFATGMPVMDITVPGVTMTATTDGGYTLSGEGIVPTTVMGGQTVPVASYTITGLGGSYASGTLTFAMKCGRFPLSYTGTLATDGAGFFGDMTVSPPATK